jgi:carboxymethylenebutenolidase
MIERQVELRTQDGRMNTFICHPERLSPHPAVIFLMDAPGIREELRDMARRLATVGYYVLLPNLYYRSDVEELGPFVGEAHIATRQKAMQLMGTINIPMVMQDIDALVGFAATDSAASASPSRSALCTTSRRPSGIGSVCSRCSAAHLRAPHPRQEDE